MRATHKITLEVVSKDSTFWQVVDRHGRTTTHVLKGREVAVEILPQPWTDGDIVQSISQPSAIWWRAGVNSWTSSGAYWSPEDKDVDDWVRDNRVVVVRKQADS